jgi:hypothetical protein
LGWEEEEKRHGRKGVRIGEKGGEKVVVGKLHPQGRRIDAASRCHLKYILQLLEKINQKAGPTVWNKATNYTLKVGD